MVTSVASEGWEPEGAGQGGEGTNGAIPAQDNTEKEVTPEEKKLPIEETEIKGKTDKAKNLLLAGYDESEVVAEGINKETVRIAAYELEKQGLRQRPKKGTKLVARRQELQVFAKGSPVEAIIDSLPSDHMSPEYKEGLRFGMLSIVAGVRIAQELSQIGIQQAKPLVEMARDMRSGEAQAAKSAAIEAAQVSGMMVHEALAPVSAQLAALAAKDRIPMGGDPMKNMMVRLMEPMMKNVLSKLAPGIPSQDIAGWSISEEKE